MNSAKASADDIRGHAKKMLASIGVSRIIIVDDEYAAELLEVEELLGICAEIKPTQAAELPYMQGIDFTSNLDIWVVLVRQMWSDLDDTERRVVLDKARSSITDESSTAFSGESSDTRKNDTTAAQSLEELLGDLEVCQYVTLSLQQWRTQAQALQSDEEASTTLILFDREFSREEEGTDQEGLKLIKETQSTNIGYYGLISHTVQKGGEYDAWYKMAEEHNLVRDRFVVIAKERLTGELSDNYGFLGMLRLAALSGRFADVKSAAWCIFEKSVAAAKASVEDLSVLDFDRIVFESSRREGVWEPETLFRVFAILMRRKARSRLYQDPDMCAAFADARRVSAMPEEVADALRTESPSSEGLRIQRFESYESDDELNRFHVPIELGDIFEVLSNCRRYILLVQPCDLMVREGGMRGYEDDKLGRTGALVELVTDQATKKRKDSWGELPYYHEETGRSAFADFAKTHQVRLAVLDLCVLRTDGVASLEVDAPCPELLIEPWKRRYTRLQKFFRAAITRYENLGKKQLSDQMKLLALPPPSSTLRFPVNIDDRIVGYTLKRIMRLRQPRSGALLTAYSQYQARAAFDHPFENSVPTEVE